MIELREKVAEAIWEAWRTSEIVTAPYIDVTWEKLRQMAGDGARAPIALLGVALREAEAAIAVIQGEEAPHGL